MNGDVLIIIIIILTTVKRAKAQMIKVLLSPQQHVSTCFVVWYLRGGGADATPSGSPYVMLFW